MSAVAEKSSRRLSKEDILERTAPLYAAEGYAATSMRDLARACGITPAALYHHFTDKEQLYLEVLEYTFRRRIGRMGDALQGLTTFEDRVRKVVEVLVDAVHEDELFLPMLPNRSARSCGLGATCRRGTSGRHFWPRRRWH